MPIFLLLLLICIVFLAAFRKKKTAEGSIVSLVGRSGAPIEKRPVQLDVQPRSSMILTVPSSVKKNTAEELPEKSRNFAFELASKHFGFEWEEFLLQKPRLSGITSNGIQSTMGYAYQKLRSEDIQDLKYLLINIPSDPVLSNDNSEVNNYTILHEGIYELIISDRYTGESIKMLLLKLIETYRASKINSILPVDIDNPALTSTSVVQDGNKHSWEPGDPKDLFSDNIIDIEPGDHKLDQYDTQNFPDMAVMTEEADHQNNNINDHRLGNLYKDKLRLSIQETVWLNKFPYYSTPVNIVEGYTIAVARYYLSIIKAMVRRFAREPMDAVQRMEEIKEQAYNFLLSKPGLYTNDLNNIRSVTEADIYHVVYKRAEAAIQEAWNAGRSPAAAFSSQSLKAEQLFRIYVEPILDEVVDKLTPNIALPDENTEIELNKHFPLRWVDELDRVTIAARFEDVDIIIARIDQIGRTNVDNVTLKELYYEAAKFIAPLNKPASLKFYLNYVAMAQRSEDKEQRRFKQVTSDQLFANGEQQQEFAAIVDELVKDKDLSYAIGKASVFYQPKRKKINLDIQAIKLAEWQLNGTVEVLNKYLNDEEEILPPYSAEVNIQKPAQVIGNGVDLQMMLLDKFAKEQFQISHPAMNEFSKANGYFKDQLIANINETYFELLDDLLIEENESGYIIDPNYYKEIFTR